MPSTLTAFDNQKYLQAQEKEIRRRLAKFKDKLYLEVGGKLCGDFHASRTLPGYDPDAKINILKKLKKDLEIIFCISAKQLSSGKVRGDWGISYDLATVRSLEKLQEAGLKVRGVVINRFEGEKEAKILKRKLERKNYQVFLRREIKNYPQNLDLILSKEGYGADDYLKSQKRLVVVWGTGPGSGKFSTCLGQIYHDQKRGLKVGYAKFETFPIWNLPLEHPVNFAYEAATADLGDYNLVDPYHLAAYKKEAINYNRDIDSFPILLALIKDYRSPTDMGINMMKEGIKNKKVIIQAAKKEIIFYLFRYRQEYFQGLATKKTLVKMDLLLKKLQLAETDLATVGAARRAQKKATQKKQKGENGVFCGAALELKDKRLITGKNSSFLHAEAACILNAIKVLANIPDNLHLLSPSVIESLRVIKDQALKEKSKSLELNEALVALAISAPTNPTIQKSLEKLQELRGCFMHATHLPSQGDQTIFRKLGLWVSTDGGITK